MEQQATYKRNGRHPIQEAGLSEYVFGKVQPQALELEEAVLGALMLDRDAFMVVSDILRPESFYTDAHQAIYRAIITLFQQGEPVDLLTVTERLRRSGELDKAGGGMYLVEISHRVASAANIEFHARIIAQKNMARFVISLCTRSIRDAYEDTTDVFNLFDTLEASLLQARNDKGNGMRGLPELTAEVLRMSENAVQAAKVGGVVGIPTGINDLDKETGGWRNSELTIVGARPGMGKTAFAITAAVNAAKAGYSVGVFSMEMAATELVQRIISAEAEVNGRHISSGMISEKDTNNMVKASEKINPLKIHIEEKTGLNIMDIRAKARRMKMVNGIDIIFIDYLQIMQAVDRNSGNREQQISEISRGLKILAKDLDVPVVALSQLSRAVETRGGSKRPQLSDLRESGSIEQDADNVYFLYRPEYYGIMDDEEGKSTAGIVEVIIAKKRNGRLCTALANFVGEFTAFRNPEDQYFTKATPSTQFPATAPTYTNQAVPRMAESDIPF